jgi:hypothetical protein
VSRTLTLASGRAVAGALRREDQKRLTPSMEQILMLRELRDLVEYLATLR